MVRSHCGSSRENVVDSNIVVPTLDHFDIVTLAWVATVMFRDLRIASNPKSIHPGM